MRLCERNKQTVYYATYTSKAEITDTDGYKTGQYTITYSAPATARWNVSCELSESEIATYGIHSKNALRIVVPKAGFALAEGDILWFGKAPDTTYVATDPKNNYRVVGLKPSLNEMTLYAESV